MGQTTYILCYWVPVGLTAFSVLAVFYAVVLALRDPSPAPINAPPDEDDDSGGDTPPNRDPTPDPGPDWQAWEQMDTREPPRRILA